MNGDLNAFFIVFGIIFFAAGIMLIVNNKMAGKPWSRQPASRKIDENRIAFLDYHPVSGDDFVGEIELLNDRVSFVADDSQEKISIKYDRISKCRTRYSTIAMITAGNFYNYLDLYQKGDPNIFVTFRFYGREWPYVKDLKSKIERKIK